MKNAKVDDGYVPVGISKGDYLAGTDIVKAGRDGGYLSEVSKDGELLSEVYVPPGTHRASRFMFEIGRGSYLIPGDGTVCYPPPVRTKAIDFGEMHTETAASQTFRVDAVERERQARLRLERRLDRFERMEMLQARALERSRGVDLDGDEKPDDAPEPEVKPNEKADETAA